MSATRDSIGWFLDHAGRIPLLTNEEEIILGRKVQDLQALLAEKPEGPYSKEETITLRRGKRAKERMVNANLRLVVSVAKRYLHAAQHLELADLVQEGMFGLIRGVEKFDPERGYKASTYLYWWIRQGISRALSQQDRNIRLPINAIECLNKVRNLIPAFCAEHGRPPTPQECADHCGVQLHIMQHYLKHAQRPSSLNGTIKTSNNSSVQPELMEMIRALGPEPMEVLEVDDGITNLDGWLEHLSDREREILSHRYGLDGKGGMSQTSTGKILGVSRQAVQQAEAKALNRLRLHAGLSGRLAPTAA
jgi:RNA polymerase sigma factor (sigma-70 family)